MLGSLSCEELAICSVQGLPRDAFASDGGRGEPATGQLKKTELRPLAACKPLAGAGFSLRKDPDLCQHPLRRERGRMLPLHCIALEDEAVPRRPIELRRTYERVRTMGEQFCVFSKKVSGRAGQQSRCAGDAGQIALGRQKST